MNTNWEKFISLHDGAFMARETFDNFCYDILNMHFPGREIVSTNEIEKVHEDDLNVLFYSKFFFDELSNSRKGQIRKAFKQFIDYRNKNHFKVYAWVMCASYTLEEEEMKWWLSWKNKVSQKYSLNIQFFDGDYCIQLAKKYNLFDKWFKEIEIEEEPEIIIKNGENENSFELITSEILTEDSIINQENKTEEVDEKEVEETESKENENLAFAQKIQITPKYEFFKQEYIRILELAKNFTKEQQAELTKINSQDKPLDFFTNIDIQQLEILNLFYKAKSTQVRNKYIEALFYFETIVAKKDYLSLLKHKISDIPLAIKKCQEKTESFLSELEGDIYSIKNESQKALICYEKSHKKDKGNKVVSIKYFRTSGDNFTSQEKYEKAYNSYNEALKIADDKEILILKKYSKTMSKGDLFFKNKIMKPINILISPFVYWHAHSLIPTEISKAKLKKSSKLFYIELSFIIIIIFSLFIFTKIITINKNTLPIVRIQKENNITLAPQNIDDIAIFGGDEYMKKVSIGNIYLIDSAINYYRRALKFDNKNEIAYNKLQRAQKYRTDYIQTAQVRILSQKEKYFISMRRVSEGLQLFKYVYNLDNKKLGKYGYVDTMMNIVIPPIYDFDYNKMYKGTENFSSGIALVCLKLSNNDTIFLDIDKKNKITKIF